MDVRCQPLLAGDMVDSRLWMVVGCELRSACGLLAVCKAITNVQSAGWARRWELFLFGRGRLKSSEETTKRIGRTARRAEQASWTMQRDMGGTWCACRLEKHSTNHCGPRCADRRSSAWHAGCILSYFTMQWDGIYWRDID